MEVIILMGLQGAGKTTFFRHHFAATHQHISKDNFPNASNRDKRQQQLLADALEQGASVVIDNTNPTAAARAPLIALARSSGAEIIGYYFQSQLKACLERNAGREGKARVPDVALYATAASLERPTYGEGFAQLFYVYLKGNGDFEVLEWQNDAELTDHGQQPI